MNSFINMKIAVTADQPLDEIVKELEKRGYWKNCSMRSNEINIIVVFAQGGFWCGYNTMMAFKDNLTTLAELKEM